MKLNISRMETSFFAVVVVVVVVVVTYFIVFVFGRFTLLEFDRIRANDSNLSHSASIK